MLRWFLLALVALTSTGSAIAQPVDGEAARLARAARVADWPRAIHDSLVAPQWLPHGEQLVSWDAIGADAGTWVVVDAVRGTRQAIIAPAALRAQLATLSGRDAALPAQMPFVLTPDGTGLLFRHAGSGFRIDFAAPIVRRVAAGGRDALLLGGGIASPRGDRVVAQGGDGFAIADAGGRVLVARTGTPDLAWQVPEQPWSSDGRLAVWQVDNRAVHHIPTVDYAAATEQVTMVPYAKVGTPIAQARLHLIDPATGRVVLVAAQGEGYGWLAGWRADGTALVLHLTRDGKRLDLVAVSRDGATRRLIREERPDTKVADLNFAAGGWRAQVVVLPGDQGLLWLSERDGWRHVYHYGQDGRLIGQVTRGAFPVVRVDHASGDGDLLVTAAANPDAPYDERLYRTDLRGGGLQPVAVEPGVHLATVSPSGRYLVDSHSSWTRPRMRDLRRRDGVVVARLTSADVSAVAATGYVPPEPVRVLAADGATTLHGAVYRPDGFDAGRRYPVVAYIYGGPFSTVLSRNHTGNTMMRTAEALAAAGFVVVAIDVRGSAGRSKAFGDATYGRIGQSEIADYVAGLRQLGRERPWMDLSRVGIHGHSWGGYFAIRAMLTAPDVFKAGYAGAPGALDEDALVNEPDMGLPAANPAGYTAGSNLALAGQLAGPLRIMHGTVDVNAPLSSSMRLVDSLIRANRPVEFLEMPGVDHNPEGPAADYYRDDVIRFFIRTLSPTYGSERDD